MKLLPLNVLLLTVCLAVKLPAQSPKPAAPKPDAPKPAATAATAAPKVQDVTPDEVEKLMKNDPTIIILDVRTPDEFAQGHLVGALNDDFLGDDFGAKLPAAEGKAIVVHCAAGGRSKRALAVVGKGNFTRIYHMNGGYNAWTKAGKPVEGAAKEAK